MNAYFISTARILVSPARLRPSSDVELFMCLCLSSFTLGSAHEKFDVLNGPYKARIKTYSSSKLTASLGATAKCFTAVKNSSSAHLEVYLLYGTTKCMLTCIVYR